METNQIMLGETDIRKYVNPLANQSDKDSLINALNKLEKRNIKSEEYFVKELKNKILPMEYPQIDISFLQKGSKLKLNLENKLNNNPIVVPRFGVYEFNSSDKFKIKFHPYTSVFAVPHLSILTNIENLKINEYLFKVYENEGFVSETEGFPSKDNFDVFRCSREKIKDYLLKKDSSVDRSSIRIESEFNGIIPEKTLEKVEESLKYFEKKNIYTIAEIKPEQWNVRTPQVDPLLVGVYDNNFYLIDHFNTTPLENLVKDNYVKDKLN